jgi:translation initiation factor 2B subunit (eIF-2B alpha/beta/delta family)
VQLRDFLKRRVDEYIRDRIEAADTVIIDYAMTKIRDGDVILVYARCGLSLSVLVLVRWLRELLFGHHGVTIIVVSWSGSSRDGGG